MTLMLNGSTRRLRQLESVGGAVSTIDLASRLSLLTMDKLTASSLTPILKFPSVEDTSISWSGQHNGTMDRGMRFVVRTKTEAAISAG